MRVALAAFGSYGDLHPMLAVALALKARGADPLIVSHPDYRTKVETAGLDFLGAGAPLGDVSDTARWVAYFRALETERRDALFRDPLARRLKSIRSSIG